MKISRYFIYIIWLTLFGCLPTYTLQLHEEKVIGIQEENDSSIMAIIYPYQKAIESEMNEVLTYTKYDLEKGTPQSTIGNFVTDLCLNYADAHICIMNNGGLRTTLVKGEITRGDIYKVMPFENELVVLELNKTDFIGLLKHITNMGGEPFSGINISMTNKGKLIDYSVPVNFNKEEKVSVITSDYLANKLWFFKDKKQQKVGIKLRDAIIDYCLKEDSIDVQLDGRIQIIEDGK